jgi:RimJ/RimL family protein N-acetyltransferase
MMLATTVPGLTLVPLAGADAEELCALLRAEREHLNTWSDHDSQIDTGVEVWREDLGRDDPPLDFGIRLEGRLIGRIRLISYAPRYGLGYWVAASVGRKGYATAAVGAVVDHARQALHGTDILAGVTHGNTPSVTVLERNGFTKVADFEGYSRYHRALSDRGLTPQQAAAV